MSYSSHTELTDVDGATLASIAARALREALEHLRRPPDADPTDVLSEVRQRLADLAAVGVVLADAIDAAEDRAESS